MRAQILVFSFFFRNFVGKLYNKVYMKKYILDLTVKQTEHISAKHVLLRLTDSKPLPEMLPGQFVEVRVDGSASTFLRRPISINFVDKEANELWLMVAMIGEGTRQLGNLNVGDKLNCVLPLGNGFRCLIQFLPIPPLFY